MRAAAVLCLLLVTGIASAEDPHVERYRQFFQDEIAGSWTEIQDARAILLRGFQKHDVPDAAEWIILEVLAKPQAGDTIREAVRILGNYKTPETIQRMAYLYEKRLSKKQEEARALLLDAFGRIKLDTADRPIELGLTDKDGRVAAAACRAIGLGPRIKYRADLEGMLKHKNPSVRAAALAALREMGGDESLPQILKVFAGDASHRVRYDAWLALRKLTLDTKRPCDPNAKEWKEFWKERSGEVPEGAPNPWGTSYPRVNAKAAKAAPCFRVPVLGDRVCFAVDITRDMGSPWRIDHKTERKKPKEERIPNFFGVKTRWDLIRAYLKDCLNQAPEDMQIAFVFWHEEPERWPETGKFLKNTKRNREKLFKHLDERELGSITAMYEGLAAAWGFVKDGDLKANFAKGADTIVFITDGRPTHGKMKNLPDSILAAGWRVARTNHVRIHSIGLYNHQFDLLKGLAKESDGLYVHVQPFGDTAEPQDLDFWPEKKKAFEAARKKKKRGG